MSDAGASSSTQSNQIQYDWASGKYTCPNTRRKRGVEVPCPYSSKKINNVRVSKCKDNNDNQRLDSCQNEQFLLGHQMHLVI